MTFLLQYGSYTFPEGFAPISQDSPRDVAEQERPRAAGAITQSARAQSRRLSVSGSAMGFGGGATAIQSAVDAIRGACEGNGDVQPLYFGRSDRYVNAQCVGITESYQEGGDGSWYGASHKLLISFLAGDPYFYAAASTTVTGLSGSGGTITPGGNAPAFATWTITVLSGTGQIYLTNTTSGQAATLGTSATAWASGDTIVLTRTGTVYTVTRNGVAAPGLLYGLIPTLGVGANVITQSASGSVALGALGCSYAARWQS